MLPGLILAHIGGKWCRNMEYFEIVKLIREQVWRKQGRAALFVRLEWSEGAP
jgi:hypothetical protein